MIGQQPREAGFDAYYAAIDADNAWQAELNRLGIDRWSKAAHGEDGSELRRLYVAKITTDAKRVDETCAGCVECK